VHSGWTWTKKKPDFFTKSGFGRLVFGSNRSWKAGHTDRDANLVLERHTFGVNLFDRNLLRDILADGVPGRENLFLLDRLANLDKDFLFDRNALRDDVLGREDLFLLDRLANLDEDFLFDRNAFGHRVLALDDHGDRFVADLAAAMAIRLANRFITARLNVLYDYLADELMLDALLLLLHPDGDENFAPMFLDHFLANKLMLDALLFLLHPDGDENLAAVFLDDILEHRLVHRGEDLPFPGDLLVTGDRLFHVTPCTAWECTVTDPTGTTKMTTEGFRRSGRDCPEKDSRTDSEPFFHSTLLVCE
jgi:hypothetical protein